LINFLAPKAFDIDRTGELIGISALVDAIVEDGEARACWECHGMVVEIWTS
jgi:hypothetical protein